MRKSSILATVVLFVATMMLSGCIFPYWGDEGRGRGGYYEGGHEGGHGGRH